MPQNASRGGGVTGGDGVGLGSDRGGLGRVTSVGLGTGLIVAGPGLSRGVDGGVGAGGGASAVNGWVVTVAGRVVAGGAGVGGVAVSGVAVGIAARVADGAGIAVGIAAGAGVAVGDSCTSACQQHAAHMHACKAQCACVLTPACNAHGMHATHADMRVYMPCMHARGV